MQEINQREQTRRPMGEAAPAAGPQEEKSPAGAQPPEKAEAAAGAETSAGVPAESGPGAAGAALPASAGGAEGPWVRLRDALVDRLIGTAWWKLLAGLGCTALVIRLFVESATVEEMFQTVVRICGGFLGPVLDFLEQLWLGFGQAVQQRWLIGVALGLFLLYLALREIRASHTTGRAVLRVALLAGSTGALLYWSAQGGLETLEVSGVSGLFLLVLVVALCVGLGLGVLYVVSEQLQGQRPLAKLKQHTVDKAVHQLNRREETGEGSAGRGLLLGVLSAVLSGVVLVFGLLHFENAIGEGRFAGVYQVLESSELYALLALAMLFPVVGTLAYAVGRWKKKPASIGGFSLCATLELLFVQAALNGPQALPVRLGGPALGGVVNLLLFCGMLLAVHWLTWLTLQLISAAPVQFNISSIRVGMSNPVAVVLNAAVGGARLLFNGVTELLHGLWMILVAGDDLGFAEPAPPPTRHWDAILPKWKDKPRKDDGSAAGSGSGDELPVPPVEALSGQTGGGSAAAEQPSPTTAKSGRREEAAAAEPQAALPAQSGGLPAEQRSAAAPARMSAPAADQPDSPAPPLSRGEIEAMRAELAARKLHERYNKL